MKKTQTLQIRLLSTFGGLILLAACNPNAPPLPPAEQHQPPVVQAEQPHGASPTTSETEASDMPKSNPNYGNLTSKVGITEQVAVAKRQVAEVGSDAALDIKKDQFQFGTVVGVPPVPEEEAKS